MVGPRRMRFAILGAVIGMMPLSSPRAADAAPDLFRLLVQQHPDGNVLISPASIEPALALLAAGTAGRTKAEIESVLGRPAQDTQPIRLAGLRSASALWSSQIRFSAGFEAEARDRFAASVFSSPPAEGERQLNAWASRATDGLIPQIMDAPPRDDGVVLATAVMFLGEWSEPFTAASTRQAAFHLPHGEVRQVPMMQRGGHFQYGLVPDGQVIDLPYIGGTSGCLILLPSDPARLETIAATLDRAGWASLRAQTSYQSGVLDLPRLDVAFGIGLAPGLGQLGMHDAFSAAAADFSPMLATPAPMAISDIVHQVVVKLDETGTRAAATTVIAPAGAMPMPGPPPFRMTVDRPFLMLIHGQTAADMLFLALVRSP